MMRRRMYFVIAVLAALAGCNAGDLSSGDRVLVAKNFYETKLAEPRRFDVVVFKYPKGPIENNTPKNYIKRLLGLPGEILAIFFGQIFRWAPQPGEAPPFQDNEDPKELWQKRFMHLDAELTREWFQAGKFEITRKTPDLMVALRRIVYDNDFPAKDMAAYPRWNPAPGSGWTGEKGNAFRFSAAEGEEIDWLRYRHLVRPKQGPIAGRIEPQLITDFMGYNAVVLDHFPRALQPNWVGDLMLECQVNVRKSSGEFWLELSRGIHRFQARWDLSTGICTLFMNEVQAADDGNAFRELQRVEIDSQPTKLREPGSYLVRFANFDSRLTVWVDRDLPFANGKDYAPVEVRGPDDKDLDGIELQQRRGPTRNDLEPASIGSRGADVQISQIKLWRDTYYSLEAGQSDVSNAEEDFWSNPSHWSAFRNVDFKTLYVQPGHYLCLGDNSQASSDSREWGVVPERLMLGRALLVYYPFKRAGPIR